MKVSFQNVWKIKADFIHKKAKLKSKRKQINIYVHLYELAGKSKGNTEQEMQMVKITLLKGDYNSMGQWNAMICMKNN